MPSPGVELALYSLDPTWVSTGRISLAAMLLVLVTMLTGTGLATIRSATGRRVWIHCISMGMFTNAIPFSLLAWGQQHVTTSFAGTNMTVVPLLVLPLSHFLVPGERLTLKLTKASPPDLPELCFLSAASSCCQEARQATTRTC